MSIHRRSLILGASAALGAAAVPIRRARAQPHYGVVVYGATSSGIAAACAAARGGKRTALIYGPDAFGGMTANGLNLVDLDTTSVIGGIPLEFFKRTSAWLGKPLIYRVIPSAAYAVFMAMMTEAGVELIAQGLLTGIEKDGPRITAISLDTGLSVAGQAWIDASYEGDLLRLSGIPWTYGRESAAQYGESHAGWGTAPEFISVSFGSGKIPYGVSKYPASLKVGDGDERVEAYTFRLCLSSDPANRRPWQAPAGYDPDFYAFELLRLNKNSKFLAHAVVDDYYDTSQDINGMSEQYPLADNARRKRIWKEHLKLEAGYYYFLATDSRVPTALQDEANGYGLALDQFTSTGNWPRQLYTREVIRAVGADIMLQRDTQVDVAKRTSIGMWQYGLDCHPTGTYVRHDGKVLFEGNIADGADRLTKRYQIPYAILHGRRDQCANLWVSTCVSASHVAYSTLRMEICYMIMGEAAGTAAALAPKGEATEVDIADLQSALKKNGVVLSL